MLLTENPKVRNARLLIETSEFLASKSSRHSMHIELLERLIHTAKSKMTTKELTQLEDIAW